MIHLDANQFNMMHLDEGTNNEVIVTSVIFKTRPGLRV